GDKSRLAGIHLHQLTRFEIRRNLNHQAGFQPRRLGLRLRRRALYRGVGLLDAQDDRLRQLDADDAIIEEHRADAAETFLQVAGDVAELFVRQRELLVRLSIHEVIAVAVAVQVLYRPQLHLRLDDPILGLERPIEDVSGGQVADLGLPQRRGAARRRALEMHIEHDVGLAVELDTTAAAELTCVGHAAVCSARRRKSESRSLSPRRNAKDAEVDYAPSSAPSASLRGEKLELQHVGKLLGLETQRHVELAEQPIDRAARIEAHLVHDVADALQIAREQGDAPLPVVEPGAAGDELQPPPGELPPGRSVPE